MYKQRFLYQFHFTTIRDISHIDACSYKNKCVTCSSKFLLPFFLKKYILSTCIFRLNTAKFPNQRGPRTPLLNAKKISAYMILLPTFEESYLCKTVSSLVRLILVSSSHTNTQAFPGKLCSVRFCIFRLYTAKFTNQSGPRTPLLNAKKSLHT